MSIFGIKFMNNQAVAVAQTHPRKEAGILRDKPNINWNKDRGKDVKSAPWYHLFKGERIYDHHLSLDEKLLARKQADNVA